MSLIAPLLFAASTTFPHWGKSWSWYDWISADLAPGPDDFVLSSVPDASVVDMINIMEREMDEVTESAFLYNLDDFVNILVLPDIHSDAATFLRTLWLGLLKVESHSISFTEFARVMLLAARTGVYPESPLIADNQSALVQVGDVVDRGPDSVLCLRILWSIERVVGWKIVSLIGNHEILAGAVIGEGEYVNRAELAEFGSLAARKEAFGVESVLWANLIARSAGLFAKFESESLLKNTLFVHAGVDPAWLEEHPTFTADSLHEYWALAKNILTSSPSGEESVPLINSNESLVWTRIFGKGDSPALCNSILPEILQRLNVNRIVVGHMPQEDHRMRGVCGSRVILTDLAMSRWLFGDDGQAGLLVMRNDVEKSDFEYIAALYYREGKVAVDVLHTGKVAVDVLHTVAAEPPPPSKGPSKGFYIQRFGTLNVSGSATISYQAKFSEQSLANDRPAVNRWGVLDCHPNSEFENLVVLAKLLHGLSLPVIDVVEQVRPDGTQIACVLFATKSRPEPVAFQPAPTIALVSALRHRGVDIEDESQISKLLVRHGGKLGLASFAQLRPSSA